MTVKNKIGYETITDCLGRIISVQIGASTKVCKICERQLPFTSFSSLSRQRLQSYCKECFAAMNEVKYRQRLAIVQGFKQKNGCIICGYSEPIGLDFHHLEDSDKEFTISAKLSSLSMKRITNEIEKCVVVCANHHREIHAGLISILDIKDEYESLSHDSSIR